MTDVPELIPFSEGFCFVLFEIEKDEEVVVVRGGGGGNGLVGEVGLLEYSWGQSLGPVW